MPILVSNLRVAWWKLCNAGFDSSNSIAEFGKTCEEVVPRLKELSRRIEQLKELTDNQGAKQ